MSAIDKDVSHTHCLFSPCVPVSQPGIFTQLMTAAEERPWLWLIYLLTVGLPVGLLVLFCWPKVGHRPSYA